MTRVPRYNPDMRRRKRRLLRACLVVAATLSIVLSAAVGVDAHHPIASMAFELPGHQTMVAEPHQSARLLSLPGQRSMLRAHPLEVRMRDRRPENARQVPLSALRSCFARAFVHCGIRDRLPTGNSEGEQPA
jgi:hypothetical protein